jgi:hypothetical protein
LGAWTIPKKTGRDYIEQMTAEVREEREESRVALPHRVEVLELSQLEQRFKVLALLADGQPPLARMRQTIQLQPALVPTEQPGGQRYVLFIGAGQAQQPPHVHQRPPDRPRGGLFTPLHATQAGAQHRNVARVVGNRRLPREHCLEFLPLAHVPLRRAP